MKKTRQFQRNIRCRVQEFTHTDRVHALIHPILNGIVLFHKCKYDGPWKTRTARDKVCGMKCTAVIIQLYDLNVYTFKRVFQVWSVLHHKFITR